ncbi:MAG: hypothetical protein U0638_12915 [Phycisphaerales bacterium]
MSTPGPSPRRRLLRRAALTAVVVLAAFLAVAWSLRWSAPPGYTPADGITIRGTIADHDSRVGLLGPDDPYVLHIVPDRAAPPVARGELVYFGSLHSKDPEHPQQGELRRVWEKFRPTVALVEGRMSFFVGTPRQGIGVFGEGATVYSMARHDGIPLYTLEPPLEIELAALQECGDRTQVAMFRVLNGYISARRGGEVSNFKIRRLLSKRAAPLTDALPDIAALDAYFAAQFPQSPAWRDMPEQAMWPSPGGTWLNAMARRSNQVRDDHFVRSLVDLVNRGERVLAIAGRSHTVVWEPVLMESLSLANYGDLSSPRPWEK